MRHFIPALLVWLGVACAVGGQSDARYRTCDQPTEVQGLIVSGRMVYYQNDTLRFARIAKETVLSDHIFPEGTWLHFRDNGTLDWCFLARDSRIQGYLFQGGGNRWMTDFYPSGKLESGGLAKVQVIDGIPCAAGTFWNETFGGGGRTHFYESGRLKHARVAQTVEYRGTKIKKGKHIRLSEDGSILFVK